MFGLSLSHTLFLFLFLMIAARSMVSHLYLQEHLLSTTRLCDTGSD